MNAEEEWATRGRFVAAAGVVLLVVALVLWSGADGGNVWLAWAAGGGLMAIGIWLERLGTFGRVVLAGGLATLYGVTFAAQHHGAIASWVAILALGAIGFLIVQCGALRSPTFTAATLALAWLGASLQPFTLFYLAAAVLLTLQAASLPRPWLPLIAVYIGFFAWWPYSEGRVDADRYLSLTEHRWTLAAFAIIWAKYAWRHSGRVAFLTLNNALSYALGVLIVPPAHPEWHWKFTLLFGFVLLVVGAFAGRHSEAERAYFVQGGLLAVLGVVSALTGREVAAMLAVASAFCVLSVTRREQGLLRELVYAAALMAVAAVWMPTREHAPNGLRLGALIGAVLLLCAVWIDARRALWGRWAVAIFTALALGVWMLTALHFTPETLRAPVLAIEALVLTATFATLGVREIPWLAKAFSLAALVVWFMQLDAFIRPWWHAPVVVASTLAVSGWWQTRGRTLIPAWEVRWVQAVAAAASMTILLLWIDGRLARQPAALVSMSVLAIVALLLSLPIRDLFLAAFSQLFTIAAVGEFIGQHTSAPLPGWLPALAPIVALPILAPILRKVFAGTEWERPVRGVAALYGVLAAAMFVVWVLHYIVPANRFPALALTAMALLLWSVVAQPRGPLLASLVCSTGALLAYWLGWLGAGGFLWRHLLAFVLLLGFGVVGRRTALLPPMIREMGIVLGLASVVHWVSLWAALHFPMLTLPVVWSVVAVIVLCLGWWLEESLYRSIAWTLLAAALVHVVWLDIRTPAAFRFGLLAVGAGTLLAAFSYSRRSAPVATQRQGAPHTPR